MSESFLKGFLLLHVKKNPLKLQTLAVEIQKQDFA
jgi:hypothetical protein